MAREIIMEGFVPDPESRRIHESPEDFRFIYPEAESGLVKLDEIVWKVRVIDGDPAWTLLTPLAQYLRLN